MVPSEPIRPRISSGMRPTGKLHLGHVVGALKNWVELQERYQSFHFIADWHALTSDFADTSGIDPFRIEMMIDWLAAGLDPQKSVLFVQSAVPQHAELHLLLSMITPLGWLEKGPHLQGTARKCRRQGLGELRLSGLSRAAGCRYPDVQGQRRAGGRRPGAPRGTHSGDRPAFQRPLRPGFSPSPRPC